jgi:hypothetical protein
MQVVWLRDAVTNAAVALTTHLPIYFTGFLKVNRDTDESIVREFSAFVKQNVNLKAFPFEPGKQRLVAPALVDSNLFMIHRTTLSKSRKRSLASRGTRASGSTKGEPVIRVPKLHRMTSRS